MSRGGSYSGGGWRENSLDHFIEVGPRLFTKGKGERAGHTLALFMPDNPSPSFEPKSSSLRQIPRVDH